MRVVRGIVFYKHISSSILNFEYVSVIIKKRFEFNKHSTMHKMISRDITSVNLAIFSIFF